MATTLEERLYVYVENGINYGCEKHLSGNFVIILRMHSMVSFFRQQPEYFRVKFEATF